MIAALDPHLGLLLGRAAAARPDHPAVEDEAGRAWSYRRLDAAADRLATRLERWGVGRGDRVGLLLPKSPEAVAAIHGVLRTGAAYVPVDPTAPPRRSAGILADAWPKAIVAHAAIAPELRRSWPGPGPLPRLVVVGEADVPCRGPACVRWADLMADDAPTPLFPDGCADDPAYVLYTSGSTGTPKGVVLTHANAACFLDWCDATLGPRPDDRFASHAPFHFDLSVFDLYASCRAAGTLVLAGEALGRDPARLGAFAADRRISVWYSAPSILAMMADHGGLGRPGAPSPRLVLFAGEVFPIGPLRRLRRLWPEAALWNLYGPTETNVCTAFPIPPTIPDDRDEPYPIGFACAPLRTRLVDEAGADLPAGAEGELVVAGPGVMAGYFGRPDLTAAAFFRGDDGTPWYRTGDLARDEGGGCYRFHGRRDRMIKKRGYRIELGEVEAALYRHDSVARAAAVARDDGSGVAIAAFVALKPGHRGSVIALKKHCTEYLPPYMIPDTIAFLPALPTTSTDKVDYRNLIEIAGRVPAAYAPSPASSLPAAAAS